MIVSLLGNDINVEDKHVNDDVMNEKNSDVMNKMNADVMVEM